MTARKPTLNTFYKEGSSYTGIGSSYQELSIMQRKLANRLTNRVLEDGYIHVNRRFEVPGLEAKDEEYTAKQRRIKELLDKAVADMGEAMQLMEDIEDMPDTLTSEEAEHAAQNKPRLPGTNWNSREPVKLTGIKHIPLED